MAEKRIYNRDALGRFTKKNVTGAPDELRNWFDDMNQDFAQVARRIPASTSYLSPGDLIMFRYKGTQYGSGDTVSYRLALVTVNQTGNISYVSMKKNLLLTCFNMPFSGDVSRMLLSKFYQKKNKAIYIKVQPILAKVFGSQQYRSYILNKMVEIYKINLDMGLI